MPVAVGVALFASDGYAATVSRPRSLELRTGASGPAACDLTVWLVARAPTEWPAGKSDEADKGATGSALPWPFTEVAAYAAAGTRAPTVVKAAAQAASWRLYKF